MTVVLDTNVLPGMFKQGHRYEPIYDAWVAGRFVWAVSTEVLCEYEEAVGVLLGREKTKAILGQMEILGIATGNLLHVAPSFRFLAIPRDVDDNKFAACAITAHAEWIVTEDRHFGPLIGSGYKPQPIAPEEFIRRVLAGT
jgi:uncharacterized protein